MLLHRALQPLLAPPPLQDSKVGKLNSFLHSLSLRLFLEGLGRLIQGIAGLLVALSAQRLRVQLLFINPTPVLGFLVRGPQPQALVLTPGDHLVIRGTIPAFAPLKVMDDIPFESICMNDKNFQ